tara:strand:- start:699 stop:1412 length:714 start_codon:yes stop_codon:yes gene_type:complete
MKKIIFQNKKTISFFILFIFSIMLFLKTNFLKNLLNILQFNESERIQTIYGYCDGESIGYLKYLKRKYKIKNNPKILNYVHYAPVNWSIYETSEINNNENHLIILNYPGKEINIELNYYKDNFYELLDSYYYSTLFESIKNIKIKDFTKSNIRVELYIKNKSNELIVKKKLQILKDNLTHEYPINHKFTDIKMSEKKFYLKFYNIRKNTKVFVTLKNKYDLADYKIIDKFKNCYFIK